MHHRDRLRRANRLGVQAGQDVRLVLAGQSGHRVESADVGLLEEVGVGDVALEDLNVGEIFGQLQGPGRVALDYDHLHAPRHQAGREDLRGAATAQQQNMASRAGAQTQEPGHPLPGPPLAHHADQVVLQQHVVGAGDVGVLAARDRPDHELPVGLVLGRELRQAPAHDGGAGLEAGANHNGLPVGHHRDLRRPRVVEKVQDPLRGLVVGIDHQVGAERLPELSRGPAPQFLGLDAHDRAGHTALFGHQRRHQVHLVLAGDGHDQLAAVEAGVGEHAGMGATALHGEHVELGTELAEAVGVDVHHRDVVALAAEAGGDVGSDLARPHDYDMHRYFLAPQAPTRRDQASNPPSAMTTSASVTTASSGTSQLSRGTWATCWNA